MKEKTYIWATALILTTGCICATIYAGKSPQDFNKHYYDDPDGTADDVGYFPERESPYQNPPDRVGAPGDPPKEIRKYVECGACYKHL